MSGGRLLGSYFRPLPAHIPAPAPTPPPPRREDPPIAVPDETQDATPDGGQDKATAFLQHITISRDQTQERQQLDEAVALRALLSPTQSSDPHGQSPQEYQHLFDNPDFGTRLSLNTEPSNDQNDRHHRSRDSASGTEDASSDDPDVGDEETRVAKNRTHVKHIKLYEDAASYLSRTMDAPAVSWRSPSPPPIQGPSRKAPLGQDDFDHSPTAAMSNYGIIMPIRRETGIPFSAGAPVATGSRSTQYLAINHKFPASDESESQTEQDSDAALSPPGHPPSPGAHGDSTKPHRQWMDPPRSSFRQSAPQLLASVAAKHGRPKKRIVDVGGDDDDSDDDDGAYVNNRSPEASSPLELEGQATLRERIRELHMELEALKGQLTTNPHTTVRGLPDAGIGNHPQRPGQRWRKIYRIKGACYLGKPAWDHEDRGLRLRASMPIANLDRFLENQDFLFIVYNDYGFVQPSEYRLEEREWEVLPLPEPSAQTISFPNRAMVQALVNLSKLYSDFNTAFPSFDFKKEISTPYLSLFYMYPEWTSKSRELGRRDRVCVEALFTYLEKTLGPLYQDVSGQLSSGRISLGALQFLVKPGDIVVQPRPCPTAFMLNGWGSSKPFWGPQSPTTMEEKGTTSDRASENTHQVWSVAGWNLEIKHGKLSRHQEVLELRIDHSTTELFDVTSLEWYPLRYASEEIKSLLSKRGHTYWHCRERRFVGYSNQGHEPNEHDSLHPEAAQQIEKYELDIEVDRIQEVRWNKKAFENLVVDDDTKHLVEALISNQVKTEMSTDLISGKGNGLIMLLHGVAELAEKPLYRVTCGDIGTKPEQVEKYLETVLLLGKIWGCGILILTSNRVGTFDQAFKSRIQLALHYENLKKPQRRKIWRNFLTRLRDVGEAGVDYDDLNDHIDDLAEEDMNGRQIRNAITTARQLAQFRGQKLSFAQLKHVIAVAGRFEGYLKGVQGGYTDDQLARNDGVR
ncbi:hypothetical protein CHGG_10058 [Chaetomium globosum CBS 148.51]|uniref:AAA+ ATPase lid domain-containing protein n=1 Tax=Chaetomium globosum (strain ATCC 6205 / CBS 148.51 / DSM 1962 / NBRC 6347 / NRRL 1970) TaxID=306901 RepID=Q2GPP6_CHAGB|nr:uncharacterized protein CHGG_10058 [Chaetomium globosum CBS 148.51]EAQ83654.1 hypothetical protein CHGG_10058 [Chaetomium globosum CBS 148.51]